jgi:ABC-type transport system involved in cytochrome c biogenesis permease subunit
MILPATLAVATEAPPAATGSGYESLAQLPLMHEGRVKPLDTVARTQVKLIHGRETIKLTDEAGNTVATWGPVAAFSSWTAAPDFWDEQEFLLVEYMPLRERLLAEVVKGRLQAIIDEPATGAEARELARKLVRLDRFSHDDLKPLAQQADLTDRDRGELSLLLAKLSASHKFLSPREVEEARVTVNGRVVGFQMWVNDLRMRKASAEGGLAGLKPESLSELEKKAIEVADRLLMYQNARGDRVRGVAPVDQLIPRPHNTQYIQYAGKIFRKLRDIYQSDDPQARQTGLSSLTALEEDTANTVARFYSAIQAKDRKDPGTDTGFDRQFGRWLKEDSDWLPMSVLLNTDSEQLAEAGFPAEQVEAFKSAFTARRDAEAREPGRLSADQAQALVASARALGSSLGDYPSIEVMTRETRFNATAPFYYTPMAYGVGFLLLLLSLTIRPDSRSGVVRLGQVLYLGGLTAFVAGLGLEVYGFYARIRISGWAPVTNMYETVIWVGAVTAILGLVLEAIYRKRYPATAAAGVAMLATLVAASAGSTILDPSISSIPPVLRSNYWLTIHVLTIVSSYAAFALAMGLGLIATVYYLTANYKRQVGVSELLQPLALGAILMALGIWGYQVAKSGTGPAITLDPSFALICGGMGLLGVSITLSPVPALVGEFLSRRFLQEPVGLDAAAVSGESVALGTGSRSSSSRAMAEVNGGGVATLTRPTVAEIRSMTEQARPKPDPRVQAMQHTAAIVKPLANYIYRAMQVGVLLVAAGTILGGVWADYSWGRFWGWDPKEVWALITLLVYLVPLHGRFAGWINTWGLVACSVLCFSSVMMAWYGVNFVLGVGLHSYGFSEGGSQEAVGLVMAAVFSLVVAAGWRRHRGLMSPRSAATA